MRGPSFAAQNDHSCGRIRHGRENARVSAGEKEARRLLRARGMVRQSIVDGPERTRNRMSAAT